MSSRAIVSLTLLSGGQDSHRWPDYEALEYVIISNILEGRE